jgi:hypothetical protein
MTSERYGMSLIKAEGLFQRHNPSKATLLGTGDQHGPTNGTAGRELHSWVRPFQSILPVVKKPTAFSGELKTHTMKTPSIPPLNEAPSPEDASFSRSRPSKDWPRRAAST